MAEPLKPRNNSTVEYFLAATYFCALLFMIMIAVRVGYSQYFATVGERDDQVPNDSFIFDRQNPDVYIKRGERALISKNFASAVDNFQLATELRKNDFVLWLRLGFALEEVGDTQGAVDAYQRSLALAPNYAQPNRLMGLLLLQTGDANEAFAYLRKAAESDNSFYLELLDLARARYISDPEGIERYASPQDLAQKKTLASYLIEHDLMTNGVKQLLVGNEISDQEKDEFIGQLLTMNKTRLAYEIWAAKSGIVSTLQSQKNMIFDGGFENISGSDDMGFGWKLEQKLTGTSVSIDTVRYHTGTRSLGIQFKGNLEPEAKIISQLVPVVPNAAYRLSFAAMSTEITSGALPVVTVTAEHTPRAASAMIEATKGIWTIITVEFKTRSEDAVLIALERTNCVSDPCPIFGNLFLDDFSMEEIVSK